MNIYILPTDKPSRLHITGKLSLYPNGLSPKSQRLCKNQHVYITNDEEIKEGDYVFVNCSEEEIEEVRLIKGYYNEQFLFEDKGQIHIDYCKKIIQTTDRDLIFEGVKPIDDEFLQWFVKNNN
jgi:hypothetical protein